MFCFMSFWEQYVVLPSSASEVSMANEEQLSILRNSRKVWNKWRTQNLDQRELSGADLSGMNLRGADLSGANLRRANLSGANLHGVDLRGVDLREADLREADLREADLRGVDLSEADLRGANLSEADLSGAELSRTNLSGADLNRVNLSKAVFNSANLREANLQRAVLIETDFTSANLTGCSIFGISAWELKLEKAIQADLIITKHGASTITVDNLEIAQFIYLLIKNPEVRQIIDTITSKAVLILGRFTPERKVILNTLREQLRKRNYTPILFDFEKPMSRDLTETIVTLAHLSRFIIADITDAKSIPQELQAIVPNLPSVAVQPLIHCADFEYAMFEHFKRYPWVLPVYQYETQDELIAALPNKIIEPVEEKVRELRPNR